MMVPAEGTRLQGAGEGTIEDTVFVLNNPICSQEKTRATPGKCLESIFSDISGRGFISFVEN